MSEAFDVDDLREQFVAGAMITGAAYSHDEARAFFNEGLAQVRRDAKIEALLEAESALRHLDPDGDAVFWTGEWYESVPEWILRRADQLEQEGKNDGEER